ncbi:MAG: ribonuclease P protein component, partial [Candidatus Saccharimonadales bacterium]
MLGRTHRFHGRKSLNGVYRHGRTARTAAMSLRYSRRASDRPYRVAVVVSRKVSKSAVTRNRIRRRIYAAVRNS